MKIKIKKLYISGANQLTFECYNYDCNHENIVRKSISIEIGEYFTDRSKNCILLNFTDKYIIYSEEHVIYNSNSESESYTNYSSIVSFDHDTFKRCVDISR